MWGAGWSDTPFDHASILRNLERRWGPPPLTARDLGAPLTHATATTDDPLAGANVPVSTSPPNSSTELPSHLLQGYADLVSRLPEDASSQAMSPLRRSSEYTSYIRARTPFGRRAGSSEHPRPASGW